MNKKIICITIIGMFLLTGISSFSAICETVENQTKTNETLQPEPEIKTTSADGVTKEIADLFVHGTGSKEYNDCNAAPRYPYYIILYNYKLFQASHLYNNRFQVHLIIYNVEYLKLIVDQ